MTSMATFNSRITENQQAVEKYSALNCFKFLMSWLGYREDK
jgi:hypothetical protein